MPWRTAGHGFTSDADPRGDSTAPWRSDAGPGEEFCDAGLACYERRTVPMYFQDVILALQEFWSKRGCLVMQPYNSEVGAGTYNPATFCGRLVPNRGTSRTWSRRVGRPTAGTATNYNRTQQFHQFQVVLKPSPIDIQDRYLESLLVLGTRPEEHDVRFVEDDWESPTLGAWGLGWQVWLDELGISQFTYFQQVGGIDCKPVSGELTYGLERTACRKA